MSKESDFVDLLNREMEGLQRWCQGKEKPKTAVGCQELVEPFIYQIEKLKFDNYKQNQRIAELEEQLKDCIKPKFKVGQTVWYIYGKNIKSFTISKIEVEIRINPLIAYSSPYIYQYEENCFATKEEAEEKLEELKGEKK